MEEIEIFGDNYRGANFAGISESITRVYLFGANIEEPTSEALIELPAMDPNQFLDIEPGIADDSFSEDWLFQQIPANTVEQQNPDVDAYRIRLVNPDSGLYVDSPLDDFLSFVHQ
ncbi:hypothetical protein GF373_10700 [bacterium]|nr:hypothetical protein [bacterium]